MSGRKTDRRYSVCMHLGEVESCSQLFSYADLVSVMVVNSVAVHSARP